MLKVSGKISVIKFNAAAYRKAVVDALDEESRNAVAEWLKAVIRMIPTYTGTARGTFAPVGRTIRQGNLVPSVTNTTSKKVFRYQGKTYPLGFGEGAKYQYNSLVRKVSGNEVTYTFTYRNYLPYVVWNTMFKAPEWMRLKNPTPWYALQRGVTAYVQYAREVMPKKLPDPRMFVKIKVVRVL